MYNTNLIIWAYGDSKGSEIGSEIWKQSGMDGMGAILEIRYTYMRGFFMVA